VEIRFRHGSYSRVSSSAASAARPMSRYASQGQAGVANPDLEETKKGVWHHDNQQKMSRGSVPRALVAMVRSTCSPLRRSSCITQSGNE
jgi:hypothetical protein